jgi:transcriptional regulator with XRE-family HTH domain
MSGAAISSPVVTSKPVSEVPFGPALASSVRSRRERAGLSQGELARMTGLSTGTLSALEAGAGNPTIGTLWAVSQVLGCTIADLLADAMDPMVRSVARGEGTESGHPDDNELHTRLIHRFSPNGPVEFYDAEFPAHLSKLSEPHAEGVYEHIWVATGSLRAGPESAPVEMRAGDYLCFQGWEPHVYITGARPVRLFSALSYTRSLWATRDLLGHGVQD